VATARDRSASASQRGRPLSTVNDSERLRWVRLPQQRSLTTDGGAIEDQLGDTAEWVGAVYRFPGVEGDQGLICPLPNILLVRISEAATEAEAEKHFSDLGLEEDEARSRSVAPFRYLRVQNPKEANAYELLDRLKQRSDLFSEVRLETMPMVVPSTASPNDPLLPQQWGVHQVQAPSAWEIIRGDASIVICILDEGCDLTHPDLRFSDPGINLGTMLPDGRPTGNHGTACAGIAAAVVDNNAGIAGMAGLCSILPLAFQNWTDVECAAGIRYAADHGASVISMSFGVYGPNEGQGPVGWDFALIDPAIAHADAQNVVLCAATGNEDINTFNRYPSRHPLVIACGASDQNDNRKSPSSPDGETWWGSNFAPGVSVVAPGVLIPTTDRQGSDGYNQTSGTGGDYFATFNGTSSATPHVAGLAGLLRSRNRSLSNRAVRDILERTAAKVGVLPYGAQPEFPNGTRNDEMGYGRVDALEAVQGVSHPAVSPATATHDLTGDGRADIVGFGDAGVWVALNNGNGTFQAPSKVLNAFAYSAGSWRVEKHPRFLAGKGSIGG
jgi:Subtilase family/FG-GAP-like repeat